MRFPNSKTKQCNKKNDHSFLLINTHVMFDEAGILIKSLLKKGLQIYVLLYEAVPWQASFCIAYDIMT